MEANVPLYIPPNARTQLEDAQANAGRGDTHFLVKLVEGYKWQVYVLGAIMAHGYSGALHPLRVRPDVTERDAYGDAFDILIGPRPVDGGILCSDWSKEVDVKARTRAFDSPDSFPFDTIIIEPAARFEKRTRLPDYWCMVSQFTRATIFISSEGASEWVDEFKTGIRYKTAPRQDFLTLEQFLDDLPEF